MTYKMGKKKAKFMAAKTVVLVSYLKCQAIANCALT